MSGAAGSHIAAGDEQHAETASAEVRISDADRDTEDGVVAIIEEFISEAPQNGEASLPAAVCKAFAARLLLLMQLQLQLLCAIAYASKLATSC